MNPFIIQMVNHKLNTIKKEELMQLAKQYHFTINDNQAEKIIAILRSETINVTNMQQRERILAKIKQQVDAKTEKQMNEMLKQYDKYL